MDKRFSSTLEWRETESEENKMGSPDRKNSTKQRRLKHQRKTEHCE